MIKRLIRTLLDWAHSGESHLVASGHIFREDDSDGFTINYRAVSNGAVITASCFSITKGRHFTTTRVVTADANPHDEVAAIIAELRLLK